MNKGKKVVSTEAMRRTQFKAGRLPHNTKFDGALSIRTDTNTGRRYKFIRVELGHWELLSRYNWTKEYGEIPPHHAIAHIDGNSLNCDLDNLECISQADNMRRNTIHRFPEEIKQNIRAISKLNRAIKKLNNA